MSRFQRSALVLTAIGAIFVVGASRLAFAEDVFHVAKGIVKSVDKGTKTMVVKTADGTEHTIKWTDKTTIEGGKDVGEGVKEGSKVSVKYTEKAGEKTAVGIKTASKATAKAVSQ